MAHSKSYFKEPELMADDHHGVYMMQLLAKELLPRYQKQIEKAIGPEAWQSVINGPDDEHHWDACDSVTNVTLTTPTGQKWSLQYAEGGIWAIPACFTRTKKFESFFQ